MAKTPVKTAKATATKPKKQKLVTVEVAPIIETAILGTPPLQIINEDGSKTPVQTDEPPFDPPYTITQPITAPYSITVDRGERISVVSEQWYSRPDDQRFTSVGSLKDFLAKRRSKSRTKNIPVSALTFEATGSRGMAISDGSGVHYPTNYAFAQLCHQTGASPSFMSKLSPELAGECTRHIISNRRQRERGEEVQLLSYDDGDQISQLRAFTATDYGRIWDIELFETIEALTQGFLGWKVPGEIDWGSMKHNPNVDVTKDNTTLYASDRDFFMFLCKDNQPIECGKLENGDPDVYFPGFYAFNSEPGYARTAGIATFMLRGVCMNRNLWGVDGIKEVTVRHTKNSMANFYGRATPMLMELRKASPISFIDHVSAAKARVIAKDDDERREFLNKKVGLSPRDAGLVMGLVTEEEGHPMSTLYDAVQGITAFARRKPHQDKRLILEAKATELLEKAA